MTATIYSFPKQQEQEKKFRIPLYTDQEIEVVLICVNLFYDSDIRYNTDTLNLLDPTYVIECLKMGLVANIFNEKFRFFIKSILKNVEEY